MSSFVFIDARVQDYERLIAGLDPGVQAVILDPALDGTVERQVAVFSKRSTNRRNTSSSQSPPSPALGQCLCNTLCDARRRA